MARKHLSRVGGFVHDINALAALSSEPDNARLLSDRSLYILQNLSLEDVTFLSRYGELLGGDFYIPVAPGSAEAEIVESTIDLVRRDLNSMSIEDLLECLCDAMETLATSAVDSGQEVEGALSGGDVVTGPGEQFPDQESYFDAKCNVSNGIFDTIRELLQWLQDNDVALLAGAFGGITTGVMVGIALSGPVGWAISLASATVVSASGYLLKYALDFKDIGDAMDSTHGAAVLALFNASDAITAEGNFLAVVGAGSPVITTLEAGFLQIILSSAVLNQLFGPRSDVAVYESPSPIDCGASILEVWDFDAGFESWTFVDISDPSCSATRTYVAVDEAIENEIVVAFLPNVTGEGKNISPAVSHAIVPGASVQVDFAATSDVALERVLVRCNYSDATDEETSVSHTAPGTLILTLTQSKTIASVDVQFGRSTSGTGSGSTYQTQLLEVRIVGA